MFFFNKDFQNKVFDSSSRPFPLTSDTDDEGHSEGDGGRSVMESIIYSVRRG